MREPLQAVGVTHTYGHGSAAARALDEVSLDLEPGRLHLVMGPSGSGKTTLLMVLGALLTPDAGEVRIGGVSLRGLSQTERARLRRQHLGFVFQSFRLFRALTALENVMIALEIAGRGGPVARRAAQASLDAVGLGGKAHRRPHELSGGEKQRVAIARALVGDPGVLLADEPTAALDSASGAQVTEILSRLAEEQGRLVLAVSHDPRLAPFAHRTLVLEDGRVVDDGRGGRSGRGKA